MNKHIPKVIILVLLSGCGTFHNLTNSPNEPDFDYYNLSPTAYFLDAPMSYYGGVKRDLKVIPTYLLLFAGLIDLPLSFVFDTLTLPVVAAYPKKSPPQKETVGLAKKNNHDYHIPLPKNFVIEKLSISYQTNSQTKEDTYLHAQQTGYLRPYQNVFAEKDCSNCVYSDQSSIRCTIDYKQKKLYFSFPFALDEGTQVQIHHMSR